MYLIIIHNDDHKKDHISIFVSVGLHCNLIHHVMDKIWLAHQLRSYQVFNSHHIHEGKLTIVVCMTIFFLTVSNYHGHNMASELYAQSTLQ